MTGQEVVDAINASDLATEVKKGLIETLAQGARESVQLATFTAAYDNLAGSVGESRALLSTAYASAAGTGNPLSGLAVDKQIEARKALSNNVAAANTAETLAALFINAAIAFA